MRRMNTDTDPVREHPLGSDPVRDEPPGDEPLRDEPLTGDPLLSRNDAVLTLAGVAKSFGSLKVLEDLALEVYPGEVFGFLGRNGAGKSTAIRILMGLTPPDAGEVRLFGQPLKGRVTALRRRIGYVAQDQAMYPWMTPKVLANFVRGFYPNWDQGRYAALMQRFDLPMQRRLGAFSGGMRARMALTVALSTRPELLVLDEPTAGMDPVARREFLDLVREQARIDGAAIFFSTHLIDEVEAVAERIAIVDGGRTLYQGSLQQLAGSIAAWSIDAVEAIPGALPIDTTVVPQVQIVSQQERRGRLQMVLLFPGLVPHATTLALAPGWQRDELSLEDIFVALVSRA